jgi:hypothetical protein
LAERGWTGRRAEMVLIGFLALLLAAVYVVPLYVRGEPGYPLDDSWIHQTYARNLAETGRWAFTAGQASAGSTSPIWTLLISLGYLAGLPHFLWTYTLGWLCLGWSGWAIYRLCAALWPEHGSLRRVAPAVLLASWPLVWAAASGMETLLFIAMTLELMALAADQPRAGMGRATMLGILGGLTVLARPEGLLLLILIVVSLFLSGPGAREGGRRALYLGLGAAVILAPYFVSNWLVSGAPFPNTFYAKQAEYAHLWQRPLALRFGQLLLFSVGGPPEGLRGISGAHLLLAPGVIVAAWSSLKTDLERRRLVQTLPLLWAVGLVMVYAWRLPVTYHHGRYLWPALPVWVACGLAGWLQLYGRLAGRVAHIERLRFLLPRVAGLTMAAMLALFYVMGMGVYRQDVAFINGEMVAVGRWLDDNTPAQAMIAAHDIGALGYFVGRPLLDMAGLVSPEVVPLLGDEEALANYVLASGADYLVTAPGWTYATLTGSEVAVPVYSTDFAWTREQGLNNMTVYRLQP